MWDHTCSDFEETSGKNSHLDLRGSRAPGASTETQGTSQGPEKGIVSPKLWLSGSRPSERPALFCLLDAM